MTYNVFGGTLKLAQLNSFYVGPCAVATCTKEEQLFWGSLWSQNIDVWNYVNQYVDTDFQFFAGSMAISWQRWRKRKDNMDVRSWIYVQSWRRHTAATCHLVCRPVDHRSRRNMNPYHPLNRHTACSTLLSRSTESYMSSAKQYLSRLAVGLCCRLCLQMQKIDIISWHGNDWKWHKTKKQPFVNTSVSTSQHSVCHYPVWFSKFTIKVQWQSRILITGVDWWSEAKPSVECGAKKITRHFTRNEVCP